MTAWRFANGTAGEKCPLCEKWYSWRILPGERPDVAAEIAARAHAQTCRVLHPPLHKRVAAVRH